MNFKYPKRLTLANLPTPIVKLRDSANSPSIYMKRDDLTGIALSGNKIRKLEFVAVDALKQGADTLITCGGIQSNHARATAVTATMLGLKSILVLRGEQPEIADGNLLMNNILGAEIRFITAEEYSNSVMDIMSDIAHNLESKGRKGYVIPEGASDALGAIGYMHAIKEIREQAELLDLEFDYIVNATGSGGTQAGLIMGKKLYDYSPAILGVNVCDDASYFENKIMNIIKSAEEKFGNRFKIKSRDIKIADGYVGMGYALNKPDEIEFIVDFARTHGIFLDPVYTGKAMIGLYDLIKKGKFNKRNKILFIHTGGIYGIFPKRELFVK